LTVGYVNINAQLKIAPFNDFNLVNILRRGARLLAKLTAACEKGYINLKFLVNVILKELYE